MSNLQAFIVEDGDKVLLSNILSFLTHHDCRTFASTSKGFKEALHKEHGIWRFYTLRELGIGDEDSIPMKGLDWYVASSLVASRWKDKKVYKDLKPLEEIYEYVEDKKSVEENHAIGQSRSLKERH